MEIMEDGNLMDRIHILIQRDLEYYKEKQAILQETICPGIVGGRLDFPRNASFAAVKLVLWWEEEFIAAYRRSSGLMQSSTPAVEDQEPSGGCGEIVKASDPIKFVSLITKSSDQLLEHLHVLSQEALDHADLTVLTGTIGAAALLKNCLWCYIQSGASSTKSTSNSHLLLISQKQYQEMGEALAERLLDLHCRLLSLYILQDPDSLDWENTKPFFESERGSYVVQMWWLYMSGIREDLWNTVPPKMAQRVFAGMLNESLTILTVRYIQARPSECRSKLLIVDISNLLLCVAQLLPSICDMAEEFAGLSLTHHSKILRDIHAKCQELFICFILRGAPLDVLHKVFRRGLDGADILRSRSTGPSPWLLFASSHLFPNYPKLVTALKDLPASSAIALELTVLFAQPQPNWALLLKVLLTRDELVLTLVLNNAIAKFKKRSSSFKPTKQISSDATCKGFLCSGDGSCKETDSKSAQMNDQQYYDLIAACTHVLLAIGNSEDLRNILLPAIEEFPNWWECFDRRQVWNQNHPPWYEALLDMIKPFLPVIISTATSAVQTGASMFQAMSIVLACCSQLWECVPMCLVRTTNLLQDILPADVSPLGNSILLQLLGSAFYTALVDKAEENKKVVKFDAHDDGTASSSGKELDLLSRAQPPVHKDSLCSFDGTVSSEEAIALALAEAICSIDEDNKHTEQIEQFLQEAKDSFVTDEIDTEGCKRIAKGLTTTEVLVSDLLVIPAGKKGLKSIYSFIRHNCDWTFQQIGIGEKYSLLEPNKARFDPEPLLHTMFHVGNRSFDQLLTGSWKPNWMNLLKSSMGLSVERVWNQMSQRWDFRESNYSYLSAHDAHIVTQISSIMK